MYQLLNFILKEIVEWHIAGLFLHSVPFSTIINVLNEGLCDIYNIINIFSDDTDISFVSSENMIQDSRRPQQTGTMEESQQHEFQEAQSPTLKKYFKTEGKLDRVPTVNVP